MFIFAIKMTGEYKKIKRTRPERLSFAKNDLFFDTWQLDERKNQLLGISTTPRVVDVAGLCICLEGEVEVVIGSRSYHIKKGDMYAVFPNEIIYVTKSCHNFKGFTIACHPKFLARVNIPSPVSLFLYIKDHPCVSLTAKMQRELIKLCELLKKYDARNEHLYQEKISKHMIMAIIYEVASIYQKEEPIRRQPFSRKKKLYYDFVQLIIKNLDKQKNVEFYADKLCITTRYLSAICKEITGETASQCINSFLLQHARILLLTSDMSIQQVSDMLNFPNPSFFSQFFKKNEGMTPKAFRVLNKNNVDIDPVFRN